MAEARQESERGVRPSRSCLSGWAMPSPASGGETRSGSTVAGVHANVCDGLQSGTGQFSTETVMRAWPRQSHVRWDGRYPVVWAAAARAAPTHRDESLDPTTSPVGEARAVCPGGRDHDRGRTRPGLALWPAVERHTNRRTPAAFYAVGRLAGSAQFVRGSSRRMTTLRSRPASIRVINRRKSRSIVTAVACPESETTRR